MYIIYLIRYDIYNSRQNERSKFYHNQILHSVNKDANDIKMRLSSSRNLNYEKYMYD